MNLKPEANWWALLKKREMSELAFILSKCALPVWTNFNFSNEIREKIKNLPHNALVEIENVVIKKTENEHYLNHLYTLFITPVVELQDGNLTFPYEVKSSFLSVFDLLKGTILNRNQVISFQSFSSSISRSLDAIRIGKILNEGEISAITEKYLSCCTHL